MDLRAMGDGDVRESVLVWAAANRARGKPPTRERVMRVEAKLRDRSGLGFVAVIDTSIAGMMLLEPYRAEEGRGEVVAGALHVSMVFVDPPAQGQGIGHRLLTFVFTTMGARGTRRISLWTGSENERARRLYVSAGMVPTCTRELAHGNRWVKYEIAFSADHSG
jgi:ribosomal protein S18 acetylase RimI-like enzyme